MISFKHFVLMEAEEKAKKPKDSKPKQKKQEAIPDELEDSPTECVIDDILNKIANCKTLTGLEELRDYCDERMGEVSISKSSEIAIYDALDGRECELMDAEEGKVQAKEDRELAKSKANVKEADKF